MLTYLNVCIFRRRQEKQTIFKKLGIPGPEPTLIYGNAKEFRVKGVKPAMREWTEQYGKIFGFYDGVEPTLVISDPDLVRQVTIKQFHKFHSRKGVPFREKDGPRENIFFASGDKWKRIRSIISPSFTAKRMKEMSPLINQSVDDLLKLFDARCKEGKPFDIYSEFGRLTTDVISSCAFGIDAGCIKDSSSPFLISTRKLFARLEKLPVKMKVTVFMVMLFPNLIKNIRKIYPTFLVDVTTNEWAFNMAKKIILARQQSQEKDGRVDFINLMLATNKAVGNDKIKAENQEKDGYDADGFLDADVNQLKKSQPMTIEEMMGQVVAFLNAGYETTSTALGECVSLDLFLFHSLVPDRVSCSLRRPYNFRGNLSSRPSRLSKTMRWTFSCIGCLEKTDHTAQTKPSMNFHCH